MDNIKSMIKKYYRYIAGTVSVLLLAAVIAAGTSGRNDKGTASEDDKPVVNNEDGKDNVFSEAEEDEAKNLQEAFEGAEETWSELTDSEAFADAEVNNAAVSENLTGAVTENEKLSVTEEYVTEFFEAIDYTAYDAADKLSDMYILSAVLTAMEEEDRFVVDNMEEYEEVIRITSDIKLKYPLVISKCQEFVNIRKEPSAESELVGRLYKDSYAVVEEREDGWTKVTSGDVTGYISNTYLYMDAEARKLLESKELLVTEITAGTVNIRKGPGTEYDIVKEAKKGNTYASVPEASVDGWNAIRYDGEVVYISADYSEETIALETALTKEQAEERDRQEAFARALASAKNVKVTVKNREPIEISDEEIYLMASVIASEALGEPYEGKLAVANVIINRMLNGYWGDTVHDVVYAKGQFSGSDRGRFDVYAKLMTEDCKKAAVEALAGHNNIDDFLFFRTTETATFDKYKKYHILENHCFYMPK